MAIRKINYAVIAPEVEQEIKDKYTIEQADNLLDNKTNLEDFESHDIDKIRHIPFNLDGEDGQVLVWRIDELTQEKSLEWITADIEGGLIIP